MLTGTEFIGLVSIVLPSSPPPSFMYLAFYIVNGLVVQIIMARNFLTAIFFPLTFFGVASYDIVIFGIS